MSQHDYVLDNANGATFRADLNNALAAVVSQNSGATAPAATYAYQLWADTSTSPATLRMRDAANAAWLVIGTASANFGLQPLDAELTAIAALAATGFISRTGAGAAAARSITGTTNVITITNGDGVAGAPTLTVGSLVARTDTNATFSKAQRGGITALTDAATITPDFSATNGFSVTLAGNRTLANPTNVTAGQSGVIQITQDATGSRALAFGSYFKFTGGTAPTLTTTANAVDELVYYVESATMISCQFRGDVK